MTISVSHGCGNIIDHACKKLGYTVNDNYLNKYDLGAALVVPLNTPSLCNVCYYSLAYTNLVMRFLAILLVVCVQVANDPCMA